MAITKREDIELKHVAAMKKEVSKKKEPETSNQLKQSMKIHKENEAKIMKSLQ